METTLPADVLPRLLDGWIGPVEVQDGIDRWVMAVALETSTDAPGEWFCSTVSGGDDLTIPLARIRLDLARWECRELVIRAMAAGQRCPYGRFEGGNPEILAPCRECHGTGYLRPPHDLSRFRDSATLSPEWSARLLRASVLRVAEGKVGLECGVTAPRFSCSGMGSLPYWMLGGRSHDVYFVDDAVLGGKLPRNHRVVPSLARITDPTEALTLIALAVLGGTDD